MIYRHFSEKVDIASLFFDNKDQNGKPKLFRENEINSKSAH